MSNSPSIYAIIPARAGSKGVPGKNVKPLAGYPLIAYSIAAARMSGCIQRAIVSTDSGETAALGRRFGAEVPFLRPAEFAQDHSTDREFLVHAMDWLLTHEGHVPDYLVNLRPTTPLRDPAIIDQAIDRILSCPDATSLRSGHEAPDSPFKWFTSDSEGFFRNFAPEGAPPGYADLPRQVFPTVYIPNGYVDVLKPSIFLKSQDIHGERILAFFTAPCCEIDAPADWEYLEFQINRTLNAVLDFLRSTYPEE